MFLRRYTRHKDGKTHAYFALVESVRTETGPRQHVVSYLGELNYHQERRWQRTVTFYNRQGESQQLRLFPDDERIALPDDPDVARIRLGSKMKKVTATKSGDTVQCFGQESSQLTPIWWLSPFLLHLFFSSVSCSCSAQRCSCW
jgi:hypothetical protein